MMRTIPVQKRQPRSEKDIDEALEESFPASDPPSYARTARDGTPLRDAKVKTAASGATRPDGAVADTPLAHEIRYRQEALGYVAAMLAELRQIAGKAGFDKLVQSLDAAYYDAYGALDAKAGESVPVTRNGVAKARSEKTSSSMEPNGA